MALLVVGEQLANQNGLASQFHLGFEISGGIQALFLGFLNENLAGNDLVLDLLLHFRCDLATGARDLLAQCLYP